MAQVVAQFVAPATFLAALLFYWGFFHARGFCRYFGVNSTVVGLNSTDYVMRSADGLFTPLAICGAVALAAIWGWRSLPREFANGPWPQRLLPAAAIISILLLLNGLSRLFVRTWLNSGLFLAPACIIIGLLMLWGVVVARRRCLDDDPDARPRSAVTPAEWTLILLLLGGSFFWGATDYSLAVGHTRAQEAEENLSKSPQIVIFSEKDLGLAMDGVVTSDCSPAGAYRHRTDGLVLIMATDHNLVVVPRTWNSQTGSAVVLPRNGAGAVRLEFDLSSDTVPRPPC
ncbi:hypothetical protein KTR9_1081 [Gordonia sp. KTR9]|nr:hypothetical protein KTR9_1081 [Gordonia sp. KTR9]